MILNPFLEFGRKTYVMGIINVTPDSFSGDGLLARQDTIRAALEQAEYFVEHGAEILDIGGESTRPGAQIVSAGEEMDRIIPVIEAVASSGLNALISVDTYKASVARAALHAGANWINDIWGLRADSEMAPLAASSGAPVIIMHNRLKPATSELQERLGGHYIGVQYKNLIHDVQDELRQSIALAHTAGVTDRQIILDPGIGFGKTVEQNLELVDRLGEIKAMGYPLLFGPSRKSFIGYTLDLPPQERIEGTAAMVVLGIARGADIVRVHDVEVMSRIVRMTDAVVHRSQE
jgi:dihydropteroate synthase